MYERTEVILQIFLVHAMCHFNVSFNMYLLLLIQENFSEECYRKKLRGVNYIQIFRGCSGSSWGSLK